MHVDPLQQSRRQMNCRTRGNSMTSETKRRDLKLSKNTGKGPTLTARERCTVRPEARKNDSWGILRIARVLRGGFTTCRSRIPKFL